MLLREKRYDGSYYLCGYAVECALKACIAKATQRSEFPDLDKVKASYTHDLTVLVKKAGLKSILETESASFRSGSQRFSLLYCIRSPSPPI